MVIPALSCSPFRLWASPGDNAEALADLPGRPRPARNSALTRYVVLASTGRVRLFGRGLPASERRRRGGSPGLRQRGPGAHTPRDLARSAIMLATADVGLARPLRLFGRWPP